MEGMPCSDNAELGLCLHKGRNRVETERGLQIAYPATP